MSFAAKRPDSLDLSNNFIGENGLKDIEGILEVQSLSILDLTNNKLDDEDILPKIFMKIENIASLKLM